MWRLQVKELQMKLSTLLREKAEALSLKAQTEEQYDVTAAQLKAKVRQTPAVIHGGWECTNAPTYSKVFGPLVGLMCHTLFCGIRTLLRVNKSVFSFLFVFCDGMTSKSQHAVNCLCLTDGGSRGAELGVYRSEKRKRQQR